MVMGGRGFKPRSGQTFFQTFIQLKLYAVIYMYISIQADRLQMIVVAKKYISVLQLFISRMPKMCAILQLVSAPLNPIPIAEHFSRSHPQCEHSYRQHIYMSKENTVNVRV